MDKKIIRKGSGRASTQGSLAPVRTGTHQTTTIASPGEKGTSPRRMSTKAASTTSTTGIRSGTKPIQTANPQGTSADGKSRLPAALETADFICKNCTRKYTSRSILTRHQKTCEDRMRVKCNHCAEEFKSHRSVRIHERRAHPHEFNEELVAQIQPSEPEVMEKMAAIENVTAKGGTFIQAMIDATGLTRDQVRYRRTKEIYREFLAKARSKAVTVRPTSYSSAVSSPRPSPNRQEPSESAASRSTAVGSKDPIRRSTTAPGHPGPLDGKKKGPARVSQGASKKPTARSNQQQAALPIKRPPTTGSMDTPPVRPPEGKARPAAARTGKATVPAREEKIVSTNNNETTDQHASRASPPVITSQATSPAATILPLTEGTQHPIAIYLATMQAEIQDAATTTVLQEVEAYITKITSTSANNRPQRARRQPKTRSYNARPPARGPKAPLFKKTQDLFERNKSALGDSILGGKPISSGTIYPKIEDVEDLYRTIMESPSTPDDHPYASTTQANRTDLPITPLEVDGARQRWRNSAPGPDGTTVAAFKKIPAIALAVVYNNVLLSGQAPTTWSTARTVLVEKEGTKLDPTNWRPITIDSTVQRLMHRVLAARLSSAITLNEHQRGFRSIDGTMANALILDGYIRSRPAARKGFTLVSLDVRKAFDTVSHESIYRALCRHGVDPVKTRYVMHTLREAYTTITVGKAKTDTIKVSRGMKQGDPLSPLLFNSVIDELLDNLMTTDCGGTLVEGVRCPAMAFADDIVLLDDSETNIALSLAHTVEFFQQRGMALNPKK